MDRPMLLANLRDEGFSEAVVSAFAAVPREEFVPAGYLAQAYEDMALPIGGGATISQPSMLAVMLDELRLSTGTSVLEIGSGCGYFLALMEAMGGECVGVEIQPRLARESMETLARLGLRAKVIEGNAEILGELLPSQRDRVVFSAAILQIPQWAIGLLAPGGFVLAPVGRIGQELFRADALGSFRTGRRCRFVPFIRPD
ncbi:MAG TPA: protein-L-isoaspartate O-methyltransferase [Fimbriimonadales bacterium]|jgi:protein-L-isoaspartate(D-aspartate) O-methyltransferase|nr:protein-L-isoaspartate O-methyltransferase [Fimbriimonadales bacterium]